MEAPALKQALRSAVNSGNAPEVTRLLSEGAPSETGGRLQGPLLLDAACNGDLPVVRALIEGGANPAAADREGKTALHWAAMRGRNAVIEYLAGLGLDLNPRSGLLHLPAAHAPQDGACETIRVLVRLGANIDHPSQPYGMAALHSAAFRGHVELIRTLVQLGADLDARRSGGATALATAARMGFRAEATVRMLIECGAGLDLADDRGVTPLMLAARKAELAVLQLLLDHGADPSIADRQGRTALHHAAGPPPEVGSISLLTSSRQDPSFRYSEKHQRRLESEWENRANCVRMLLKAGADPSTEDNYGRRPVDLAAGLDDGGLIRTLLRARGELNR